MAIRRRQNSAVTREARQMGWIAATGHTLRHEFKRCRRARQDFGRCGSPHPARRCRARRDAAGGCARNPCESRREPAHARRRGRARPTRLRPNRTRTRSAAAAPGFGSSIRSTARAITSAARTRSASTSRWSKTACRCWESSMRRAWGSRIMRSAARAHSASPRARRRKRCAARGRSSTVRASS